jgi:hypothetical protein
MDTQSRNILIIAALIAIGGGYGAFRPAPVQENYQTIEGVVSSATAVTKEGQNDFRVKVWLEGQDTGYQLAAKVPGNVLGRNEITQGGKAELLALKTEIEKPFKGLLGNVEPSIEIASLKVDGTQISGWDDKIKHDQEQRKLFMALMIGAPLLGVGITVAKRFQAAKSAAS